MYESTELKILPIPEFPMPEEAVLPGGSRARSKARNRQKILESATALFRERGFEAATLRDIARHAGLSTGAVFANFTDKSEVFLLIVIDENARVINVMRQAYDESLDLVARLHKQLMAGYESAQVNARLILSAFVMKWSHGQASLTAGINEVSKVSDLVRHALLDTLKAAQDRKELPAGAKIECAAEVLEDLCFANMRRAFQASDDTGAFDMDKMASNLTTQIQLVVAGLKAT
jgi:AcrR family transcriptional regulator